MTRSRQTADWGSRAGLAKIVPSSVAVGSGTGSANSFGTVSFSGASSVSLNDVFSTTYQNYRIIITGIGTVNQDFGMRLRVNNSDDSTASSYVYQYINGTSTTVSALRNTTNLWYVGIIGSTLKSQLELTLAYPFEASPTNFYCSSASGESSAFIRLSGGTHNQSTSYTGFTIFPASGTMTGEVSVYGYTK